MQLKNAFVCHFSEPRIQVMGVDHEITIEVYDNPLL